MSKEIKIIGFTDSVNDCDCCGKSNLKGTYCIFIDGSEFYYGVTCASKHTGIDSKSIKSEVKNINTVLSVDAQILEAKGDYSKVKIYNQAIKIGYPKDDFFKKHGKLDLDFSSPWENVYFFAHLNHRTCK